MNYVLAKRLELLEIVSKLQATLTETGGDAGATCELAHHFHVYHVRPRWQRFCDACDTNKVLIFFIRFYSVIYRVSREDKNEKHLADDIFGAIPNEWSFLLRYFDIGEP